jgi:hypothetical protein
MVLYYLSIVSVSGLKVIGVGMSRTGTRTLKRALEILFSTNDYHADVYHADIWLGKMDHIEIWKEYFDGSIRNKTAGAKFMVHMRLRLTSQRPSFGEN